MIGIKTPLTIEDRKELAADGLHTARIMADAARKKHAAGEITYEKMVEKEKEAMDYYNRRLIWLEERCD